MHPIVVLLNAGNITVVQDTYFNWEMYIFHGSVTVRVDHLRAPIHLNALQRLVLVVNIGDCKVFH